jgi:hypothetical protein
MGKTDWQHINLTAIGAYFSYWFEIQACSFFQMHTNSTYKTGGIKYGISTTLDQFSQTITAEQKSMLRQTISMNIGGMQCWLLIRSQPVQKMSMTILLQQRNDSIQNIGLKIALQIQQTTLKSNTSDMLTGSHSSSSGTKWLQLLSTQVDGPCLRIY